MCLGNPGTILRHRLSLRDPSRALTRKDRSGVYYDCYDQVPSVKVIVPGSRESQFPLRSDLLQDLYAGGSGYRLPTGCTLDRVPCSKGVEPVVRRPTPDSRGTVGERMTPLVVKTKTVLVTSPSPFPFFPRPVPSVSGPMSLSSRSTRVSTENTTLLFNSEWVP